MIYGQFLRHYRELVPKIYPLPFFHLRLVQHIARPSQKQLSSCILTVATGGCIVIPFHPCGKCAWRELPSALQTGQAASWAEGTTARTAGGSAVLRACLVRTPSSQAAPASATCLPSSACVQSPTITTITRDIVTSRRRRQTRLRLLAICPTPSSFYRWLSSATRATSPSSSYVITAPWQPT